MEIVSIFILCFISILLIVSTYVMIRNHRVYTFRKMVCDLSYMALDDFVSSQKCGDIMKNLEEYEEKRRMVKGINDRSYDRMLYSFKPLKLEYWYSEEEIVFIKKGMKLWKNRKS